MNKFWQVVKKGSLLLGASVDTSSYDYEEIDGNGNIKRQWRHQVISNEWYTQWREDLAILRKRGFEIIRMGLPWELVEPFPGDFRLDLLKAMVKEARHHGFIVHLVGRHYNAPEWLTEGGKYRHPTLSHLLGEALALLSRRLLEDLRPDLYSPSVETDYETYIRGAKSPEEGAGWPPGFTGTRESYREILVDGFTRSAKIAREYGAVVVSLESVNDLVVTEEEDADIAGMNLLLHVDHHLDVGQELIRWYERLRRPIALTEIGIPEWFSLQEKRYLPPEEVSLSPGVDTNRRYAMSVYREGVRSARKAGVPIMFVNAHPTIPNMHWGDARSDPGMFFQCDRAGLWDGEREKEGGKLRRVPCEGLIEEVLSFRTI